MLKVILVQAFFPLKSEIYWLPIRFRPNCLSSPKATKQNYFIFIAVNYLIVEALKRYDYFYGTSFKVECPTGSGNLMRLRDVATEISNRLVSVFLPDKLGRRPCHGNEERYATDEDWNQLVLFYEYFEPETGRGCGARWVYTAGDFTALAYKNDDFLWGEESNSSSGMVSWMAW